ncbi:MAG TPA: glycosyltransferase, partial [Candidatus Wunengus sp. YC61]|uniref:glycosyltransferase n=1 Tax=Candidatus Wunengus sp. YC61 TaxID=3367698 RepID=UPI0040291141
MNEPLFSIITINLNNEKGLLKTLQSISEQTFTKYELIVIDGGSTDNSLEICNKYQGIITKVVSERDNGISDAFNKGTFLSTGKIITYLNSGDVYLHKDVLQMVKRAYEEHGPWKWAYGLKKHVDANGNLFPPRSFERMGYNFLQFSLGKIVICHQAVFFDNGL